MTDLLNPTPDHRALRVRIRAFAEERLEPEAAECDRSERFNRPRFEELGAMGLLGLTVPTEFGGAGLDLTAAVLVHEELAAADPGFTLSYLTHAVLFSDHLARSGSVEQKQRYLPDACAGRTVCGMAISEAGGGTDVMAMTTRAVRDGDHYLLDGAKMWITNGTLEPGVMGDAFLVYARTSDAGPRGISLFLVDRGTPGFSLGRGVANRLGVRASPSAELRFVGCRIPVSRRVGAEGAAVMQMMKGLQIERLTMAAMGLGIARRCLELMNAYASQREAFGQKIRGFGQIQRHIAESYAELLAGRAMVYEVASRAGQPQARIDADAAKLYCATMAKTVADRAIQVMGAYGYSGESVVARLWRDAKLLEIGGGTLEAHQKNITRGLTRLRRIE